MRFYVPPRINSDFQSALDSEISTEFTVNFDTSIKVKAIVPELDFRSKQSGFNGTKPLYAEIDKLEIGYYMQNGSDTYIVTYRKEEKFPRCAKIQIQLCNSKITFLRYQEEKIDMSGNVISPEGDIAVAADIYSVVMMSGYEFQVSSGGIGIVPNDKTGVQMQFNNITKNIKIDDTFNHFGSKYRIENIDYSQVNIDGTSGIMIAFAKKIP